MKTKGKNNQKPLREKTGNAIQMINNAYKSLEVYKWGNIKEKLFPLYQ